MRNWVGRASLASLRRLLLVTCLHKLAWGAETEQLFASSPPPCAQEASLGRLPGPQWPMYTGRTPALWQYSPPGSRCTQNRLVLLCRNPVEAGVDTQLDTKCGHSPSPGSQRGAEVGASPREVPFPNSHKASRGPAPVLDADPSALSLSPLGAALGPSLQAGLGAFPPPCVLREPCACREPSPWPRLLIFRSPGLSAGAVSTWKGKEKNAGETRESRARSAGSCP